MCHINAYVVSQILEATLNTWIRSIYKIVRLNIK